MRHEAISAGNLETALYILESELIDSNEIDEHGNTPLHTAANSLILGELLNQEDEAVKRLIYLLIRNGADINAQNTAGFTPVHRAVLKYNTPFLRFILGRHEASDLHPVIAVNLNIEANGFTAVELACQRNSEEMVSLLLSGSILTDTDRRSSLLLQMVQENHIRVFRILTRENARNLFDLNSLCVEGNTVLHMAVRSKNVNLVGILLNLGARPDIKNKAGKTALDLVQDRPAWSRSDKEQQIMRLLEEIATNPKGVI